MRDFFDTNFEGILISLPSGACELPGNASTKDIVSELLSPYIGSKFLKYIKVLTYPAFDRVIVCSELTLLRLTVVPEILILPAVLQNTSTSLQCIKARCCALDWINASYIRSLIKNGTISAMLR